MPQAASQAGGPSTRRAPPRPTGLAAKLDSRPRPDEIEGQARAVVSRSDPQGESGGEMVWTFRVERYDDAGNRVLFVPVEMRGYRFEGSIAEGDLVRLRGSMKRGTLEASEVENITTGATVTARRTPRAVGVVVGGVFLVVFVAVVAFMVFMVVKSERASDRFPNGRAGPPAALTLV